MRRTTSTQTRPFRVCGCNEPDIDSDGDGVLDCNDGCPTDSSKLEPGQCGCDQVDTADCTQPCICDWKQVPANVTQKFKIGLMLLTSLTLTKAEHWMPPSSDLIDNKCDREPCPTAQEFLLGMRKKVVQVQTRMAMAYSITTSGWTLFVPILRTAVVASVMQPTREDAAGGVMDPHALSVRKSNRRPANKVTDFRFVSVQNSLSTGQLQ